MIAKTLAPEMGAKLFVIMIWSASHTMLVWRTCRMGRVLWVGTRGGRELAERGTRGRRGSVFEWVCVMGGVYPPRPAERLKPAAVSHLYRAGQRLVCCVCREACHGG
jgi:hypothetical protein